MKKIKTYLYSILLVAVLIVPLSTSNFLNARPNEKALYDSYRVGCKCCDGWDSKATGRGACSHHDGVKYWIYYDEDTDSYYNVSTGRCD